MPEGPPPLPQADSAVPPTAPGQVAPPRSSWPTALGVIGIVLGALGTIGSGFGIAGAFMQSWFADRTADTDQAGFFEAQAAHLPAQITTQSLMLLAAIVLLYASIALLKRRPAARMILLAWSIGKIIATIAYAAVQFVVQRDMMNAMASSGGAMPPAFGSMMGAATVFFALVFSAGPAVFALVWFTRPRIRDEMAAWPA